jgi:hypothetical protein
MMEGLPRCDLASLGLMQSRIESGGLEAAFGAPEIVT